MNRRLRRTLSGKIVDIKAGELRFLADLGDWTTTEAILQHGWEEPQRKLCRRFIDPGDIVFDIGSHNGQYAVLFGSLVGTKGRVYAFEPLPANIELLRGTIALNLQEQRVIVEPMALSDQKGEVSLLSFDKALDENDERYPEASGMTTSIIRGPGYSEADEPKAVMTTLDDYASEKNIGAVDFVKIDTEGAELRILHGGRDLLRRSENLTMLIEVHADELRSDGRSVQDVLDELLSMELKVFDTVDLRPITKEKELRGNHVLCTRREIA